MQNLKNNLKRWIPLNLNKKQLIVVYYALAAMGFRFVYAFHLNFNNDLFFTQEEFYIVLARFWSQVFWGVDFNLVSFINSILFFTFTVYVLLRLWIYDIFVNTIKKLRG